MPATVQRSVMHHGKRHKFRATAKDDSLEAFKEALSDLDRQVTAFVDGNKPKVARQKFRRK
ncbi:MAG: hypothetical protein EDM03_16220 [Porphyrobacter sp. IPPAS B-1204]|nr:MAG: hypothetical protein EDM03_16220 [Porphyrobacter sp. IPPAS B-1204]